MVNWTGIEDINSVPNRVWLSREKETDEWQPLRKSDCQKLNKSPDKPVVIEHGRATADPEFGKIRYNYIGSELSLTSATWFVKKEDENDKSKSVLIPMDDRDAQVVEQLYQTAIYAASSFGEGIDSIDQAMPLFEDNYQVKIEQQNRHYIMRKAPTGWFAKSYDLQRGYGAYKVEGEEDEELLGSVKHLVFFVHGVGEAMWSRDDVNFAMSLRQEMDQFRLTMQKRQIESWRKACEAARKKKLLEPPAPHRVEVVPIAWFDRIHSSSSSLMNSLHAATLKTIPALREIANDVIFDVLMYLTPTFCHEVLECVTDQIQSIYEVFKKNHPKFAENGGKCSLVGHSLGSVICWDLLCVMKEGRDDHGVHITKDGYSSDVGYQQYASGDDKTKADNGSWGPSLPKPLDRHIPFEPDFTLFVGSPLGLFLTLRGAHPVFDAMRENPNEKAGQAAVSPFTLPSGSIHNIFHPSDPIAYRIEPLLLPPGTEHLPAPMYVTSQGQGVRFHVKAGQLGDDIRKSMNDTKRSVNSFMSAFKESATNILKQLDDRNDDAKRIKNGEDIDPSDLQFPLAGKNGRLDLQLQPSLIGNEYVSAVMAHSSYFSNTDIVDYVIDLTGGWRQQLIVATEVASPSKINALRFIKND